MNASKVTPDCRDGKPKAPPLPLDWTRVKRKRADTGEECQCDDPSCGRRKRRPAPLSSATVAAAASDETSSTTKTYRGTAIICLHESDPQWFQGYFVPQVSPMTQPRSDSSQQEGAQDTPSLLSPGVLNSAWGLLGEQQEIDDCLQCADGGFRVLKLTVYPFQKANKKRIVMPEVEWTGGEMIRLLQPQGRVRMEPQHLWTDNKAVPYVQAFFGGLVRRLDALQSNDSDDDDTEGSSGPSSSRDASGQTALRALDPNVLKVMPDVAIIVGAMEIVLPNDEPDDDSGFMDSD